MRLNIDPALWQEPYNQPTLEDQFFTALVTPEFNQAMSMYRPAVWYAAKDHYYVTGKTDQIEEFIFEHLTEGMTFIGQDGKRYSTEAFGITLSTTELRAYGLAASAKITNGDT